MLSHLRRTSPAYLTAFSTVLNSSPPHTSSTFEHPLLSRLHSTLVVRGQFAQTEALLEDSKETGLFREWCSGGGKGKNIGRWEQITGNGVGEGGVPNWPAGRGGHQMVRVGRKILLFGGWDGERDLGDLWEYELPLTSTSPTSSSGGWRCLHPGSPPPPTPLSPPPPSSSTDTDRRPRGRSCHQMAVDERTGWVYLLGAKLGPEEEDEWAAEVQERETAASEGSRRPPPPSTTNRLPTIGLLGPTMAGAVPIPPPTGEPRSRAGTPGATAPTSNGTATTNGDGGDAMDVEQEAESPSPRVEKRNPYKADFWRYKAVGPGRGKWELLCEDTGAVGGPKLL